MTLSIFSWEYIPLSSPARPARYSATGRDLRDGARAVPGHQRWCGTCCLCLSLLFYI